LVIALQMKAYTDEGLLNSAGAASVFNFETRLPVSDFVAMPSIAANASDALSIATP
jgi:hypothetical protein